MNGPADSRPAEPPAPVDDENIELPVAPRPPRRTLLLTFAGMAATFAVLFGVGLLPRVVRARQLHQAVSEAASTAPTVQVVTPRIVDGSGAVTLPGSIEPLRETWVYARANGYVREWMVDIGESVAEGQALLDLETPELDAELNQAKANFAQSVTGVDQAKANRDMAKITTARFDKLGPSGVASQQDVDDKRTALAVAQANLRAADAAVESQRANVSRLTNLKSFAKVSAPFSGRVTARNVEKGQLINAGAAGGQGLYRIAQVETVRVFIHVPQDQATSIEVGQPVSVSVRDRPGQKFIGKVTHTAGALDPASRTLNTEVQIPNEDHRLLAGMYVQASIQLGNPQHMLRIPSAALVADGHGTRVMTVDSAGRLKSIVVQLGHDLGTEVEIADGLRGDEQVVTSVPAGTAEGTVVKLAAHDGPNT